MHSVTLMIVRRRCFVSGRVQGVFFRDSARQRARAHGVAGWIRNTPQGAVEAVLEGPPDAVDRVGQQKHHRHRAALVGQLEHLHAVLREDLHGSCGLPTRHCEIMGNDTRPGAELLL